MTSKDGFDGKKRWGNSGIKGHGVNSPAMMAARKAAALKKKTGDDANVGKCGHAKCAGGNGCYQKGRSMVPYRKS